MTDSADNQPVEQNLEEFQAQHRKATMQDIWTTDDTGHDLTVEEALFVRSYIIDRNEIAALKRLGYGMANAQLKRMAARHLANPEVQGAIDCLAKRLMAKLEISAENVNRSLAAVAFFDPREIMHFDGHSLRVLDSRLWSDRHAAAIKGVKMTKDAGVEIQFADRLRAQEILAKQLGTLKDADEGMAKMAADAAAQSAIERMVQVVGRLAEGKPASEQIVDNAAGATIN